MRKTIKEQACRIHPKKTFKKVVCGFDACDRVQDNESLLLNQNHTCYVKVHVVDTYNFRNV